MKHGGRTTDNAVQTKGNVKKNEKLKQNKGKKPYKPGKQTSGTLKHFRLPWNERQ